MVAAEVATKDHLVRRISIFPFSSPSSLSQQAENAWWDVRGELTKNRRFLVASRHFLEKKEVFQKREQLEPADVLVLSKLLEAHALVTCYMTTDRIYLSVYNGQSGWLLWESSLPFDKDLPLKEQVKDLALRLTRSFVASVPYQGFVVNNGNTGKVILFEGDIKTLSIHVGVNTRIQPGDEVQFLRLQRRGMEELFKNSGEREIYGRGRVIKVEGELVTAELLYLEEGANLQEYSLARFPQEARRLARSAGVLKDPSLQLAKQIQGQKNQEKEKSKGGALITALAFVGNALLFFLLAF